MGVTLRERTNKKTGSISFRLDIIHKGNRTVETLPFKLLAKPKTLFDKEQNKLNKKLAEQARANKEAEIFEEGRITKQTKFKTPVVEWMLKYCEAYTKKDKRNMEGVTRRFANFLKDENLQGLSFGKITEEIVENFWEYLKFTSTGEGDKSYFARFKKIMKAAYKKGLMPKNIAADVIAKNGGKAKKKDILTLHEIETLLKTQTDSKQVKNAFLFCCFTGLRWVDIKQLRFKNIDYAAKSITVIQEKTKIPVSIPLNDATFNFLPKQTDSNSLVFVLPTANGANKTIKAWIKRAAIDKKITWHNARHSFGTNLILTQTDVVTASKLLGHTSLEQTQRYVDTASELKRKAVDGLRINLVQQ